MTYLDDRLSDLGYSSYEHYLRSQHWMILRKWVIGERGMCESCSSRARLGVHHRTYIRLGMEMSSDVEVLCGTCHCGRHLASLRSPPGIDLLAWNDPGTRYLILRKPIMTLLASEHPGSMTARRLAVGVSWPSTGSGASRVGTVLHDLAGVGLVSHRVTGGRGRWTITPRGLGRCYDRRHVLMYPIRTR